MFGSTVSRRFRAALICAVALVILCPGLSRAQRLSVEGRTVAGSKRLPLAGAHLRLIDRADTTDARTVASDADGHFMFAGVQNGSYLLEGTYLGYATVKRNVEVKNAPVDVGTLEFRESEIPLHEVVVEGRVPPAVQKEDTTEYNAQAFKMQRDASAEDLVTKMPGVTVENGTVKAQGEDVQQVLVDGRQFFGNDPTLALRNLPAEIIDKVQVFDKLSDQAQFTGFDDGRSVKTMNIVTRADRRQGQFGKVSGGYGTDDRYTGGGSMNTFHDNLRLSLIGLTNNVNQQNFSTQDLLGVMGGGNQRGGRGGGMFGGGRRSGSGFGGGRNGGYPGGPGGSANNFLVGQQSGISTVHSLGANCSDSLGDRVYAQGSYFFNLTDNHNPQVLNRQYTLSPDSSIFYNENTDAQKKNYNHRLNFRVEYTLDSSNSFVALPQINLQENRSASAVNGTNEDAASAPLNRTANDNQTTTNGYSSQNHVLFRHRFPARGRTISVDIGAGLNRKQSDGSLFSEDIYYTGPSGLSDTIDQQSTVVTDGYSLSSNIAYTEPVGSNSLVQVSYGPSYSATTSDNRTYSLSADPAVPFILNTALSNSYENKYLTQSGGLSYRLRVQSLNLAVGVSYQIARLDGDQSFPSERSLTKTFYSVLPNSMLNYAFSRGTALRLFYRSSTTSPSVTQLQDVVDNTNPLLLTSGNPDLRQSLAHTVVTRLSLANTESARSMLLFFTVGVTKDYIANSTLLAARDTVLPGGLRLGPGTQLTVPVNLAGYWNARSFVTCGLPVDLLKSTRNLNAGITYTHTPGLNNGVLNESKTWTLSPGFVLGSNVSEDVDFTLSYSANFNTARNSVTSDLNNNYFSHTAALKSSIEFREGIVLRNDLTNTLYAGLGAGLDRSTWLWNASIGKKLFQDERGELLLSVYDLLNQNNSISRTVTDTYIEDAQTQVLRRYLLLTFTYNLRQFAAADR